MIVGHASKDDETKTHCDGRYIVVGGIFQNDDKFHSLIIETNNYAYDNRVKLTPYTADKKLLFPVLVQDPSHKHHDYSPSHHVLLNESR